MNTQFVTRPLKKESPTWERAKELAARGKRPFVYGCLLIFAALYYYRPQDFIPGLDYLPMARIAAFIGSVALLVGMMGGQQKVPRAIKYLILLLVQLTLCIPFAMWRGGAFNTVYEKFAKGVIAALLIGMAVVTVKQLRKLLWIQVSAVALVTFASIALRHMRDGRLWGIQKSMLENPNDLAINIAISFPLGVAFMLHARGLKKVIWGLALIVMALGVVLTYSRSGLLAFILTLVVCVWEYGIKGKRPYIMVVTAVTLFFGLGAALSTAHYRARVESIFLGNIEGSGDRNSLEARKDLLKKSVITALKHPVFGIGPGCFDLVDETWRVAHNTYTELAAEGGFPALILFLMSIGAAFKNIAIVKKSQHYRTDPELKLFTQALWAGIMAYLAGALFASTEYNLYPYFMVAYTCAVVRIVNQTVPESELPDGNRNSRKTTYERFGRPQPVYSR